jgi:hypothetical protein
MVEAENFSDHLCSSSSTVYSSKTKAAESFYDRLDMELGGRKPHQQRLLDDA